jgi:hypothetical protein
MILSIYTSEQAARVKFNHVNKIHVAMGCVIQHLVDMNVTVQECQFFSDQIASTLIVRTLGCVDLDMLILRFQMRIQMFAAVFVTQDI